MKKMTIEGICIILAMIVVFLIFGYANLLSENTQKEVRIKKQNETIDYMNESIQLLTQEVRQTKMLKESYKRDVEILKNVKLTAYCSCEECSEGWGKQTKSGNEAVEGRTVAIDTKLIEIGSEVKINGKTYIAEDVGGGVKGLHIDIYMDSHNDVDDFGVQTAKVVEVKKGKK